MRRFLLSLLFVLALFSGFFLLGCQKTATGLKIALDIEDEGRYDELFAYFTAQTGISISATYGQDIGKLVGTADEPDIIKTSTVAVQAMKDSLLDLTPYIEADGEVDVADYIPSLMSALTIEGKVYALPTSVNTSLLYYNRALFDASAAELRTAFGLSEAEDVYPKAGWTYADYQKAGVILSKFTGSGTDRTYTQFGAETQLTWWGEWYVYVRQMGGAFYQEGTQDHVCAINSAEALAATTFFREKSMGDETQKFGPDAIEASSSFSFMAGNVAMILGGHMGDWYSYDALGLDWGVQVLPTPVGRPEARGGEISADAFGISVRSRKAEEAFLFLKMWAGDTGALEMYKYGKVGALNDMEALIAALPETEQKDIDISAVFDAMALAETLPSEKDFSKMMLEMTMTEIYKLMYAGRGSESDVATVLNRIKTNVDAYYAGLYD